MNATQRAIFVSAIASISGEASAHDKLRIVLPEGLLSGQVTLLGQLGGINVAVPDQAMWLRHMPCVRGDMTVMNALDRVALNAGARVEVLGPHTFRLSPRPVSPDQPQARRRSPPAPPHVDPAADIVVTASKRGTARRHFAGQVTRVDGADLEFVGVGGTERLTSRTASIASTYLGAGRNKLFIRGLADSSFTGPTQATVGQYYGDLRLSYNAPDPDLRLADLASVEVLEGPQGTLYGAGSLGGLIRLVPNRVDLTRSTGSVSVGASATTHGAPSADAQAVLNLPVIENRLGVRLVGTVDSEGGYIDKPMLGRRNVNRTRIEGGRATVHLDLGDGWSAEAIGIGQRTTGKDSQYADRDGPPLTRQAPVAEGFRARFGQAQLVIGGHIGSVNVRSSTGLTTQTLAERYDATFTGDMPQIFAQSNHTRMRANETRAWQSLPDGSGWLAGFSYTDNRTLLLRSSGKPEELIPTIGVVNRARETTIYGEGSLHVLPFMLLTAGLRFTRTVIDGSVEEVPIQAEWAAFFARGRRSQFMALPAVSMLFEPSPRSSLFLRYEQGFRPGGLAIEGNSVRRFRNDSVSMIEAGYRLGQPGKDPIDLSATLAHTAWRDIQADFIDEFGFPSTANVGDGELWTLEGNVGFRLTEALRLDGAFTYNVSRIKEGRSDLESLIPNFDYSDSGNALAFARLRQIPNIARFTLRAGFDYRRRLGERADLKIEGWMRFVGPSRLGVGPVLGQSQGNYVDTGLTMRIGLGRVGITTGITNVTDARGNRFAFGTPIITGRDQITPLRPRTFRFGLDSAF